MFDKDTIELIIAVLTFLSTIVFYPVAKILFNHSKRLTIMETKMDIKKDSCSTCK